MNPPCLPASTTPSTATIKAEAVLQNTDGVHFSNDKKKNVLGFLLRYLTFNYLKLKNIKINKKVKSVLSVKGVLPFQATNADGVQIVCAHTTGKPFLSYDFQTSCTAFFS